MTRLITVTQTVAVAVSITGLAVWMIWHWSEVVDGITSELNSISSWSSSGIASSAVVLIYLSLALLCVNVLLTVRAIVTNNKKE